MIASFSSKKPSKISKRTLRMESLESREMLSVNPLGYEGDVIQTSQTFGTEAVPFETEAAGDLEFVSKTANSLVFDYTLIGTTDIGIGDVSVTPAGGSVAVAVSVGGVQRITITGLAASTKYTVIVTETGEDPVSKTESTTTVPTPKVSIPTGLAATGGTATAPIFTATAGQPVKR